MSVWDDDWLSEWLHLHNSQMLRAQTKAIEDAILGTGVSKVSWNETCRCGQPVTVATLDTFRKSKTGLLWRHKDSNDCIAYLKTQLADQGNTHRIAINRQADRLDDLNTRVKRLEKRRWWQR